MAAKPKAKSAAKKKPVKKAAPKKAAVKKSVATAGRPTKKNTRGSTATVKAAAPRKPRKTKLEKGLAEMAAVDGPKIAARPEWFIVNIYVDNGYVYGLANDQRVYRWNHRSALWVLHKEGLQP